MSYRMESEKKEGQFEKSSLSNVSKHSFATFSCLFAITYLAQFTTTFKFKVILINLKRHVGFLNLQI